MAATLKSAREKLSTTVSSDTYQFLQNMVTDGEAATLAEALDVVVARVRRLENRKRLATATTAYFEQLEPEAAHEEKVLAEDLDAAKSKVDFETEI